MTEAVIKFELLSQDPTTYVLAPISISCDIQLIVCLQVKVKVPEVTVSCEDDVRFDGAFVLYNYARVSTLLNRHTLACQQGNILFLYKMALIAYFHV